jgi:hypothetical protein
LVIGRDHHLGMARGGEQKRSRLFTLEKPPTLPAVSSKLGDFWCNVARPRRVSRAHL